MTFNYNKLRGRIVEKFGTQREFAKKLGTAEQTVNAKLAGRIKFSIADVLKWAELLEIDQNEIGIYFFDYKL